MSLRTLPEPLFMLSPGGTHTRGQGKVDPSLTEPIRAVEGRYGEAWRIFGPSTNYVRNPVAAYSASGATFTGIGYVGRLQSPLFPGVADTAYIAYAGASGANVGFYVEPDDMGQGSYTASAYVFASPAVMPRVELYVEWYNGSNALVHTDRRMAIDEGAGGGEPARIHVSGGVPVWFGATHCRMGVRLTSAYGGEEFYVTGLQMEDRGDGPSPLLTGDMGAGFSWIGAPHASRSQRLAGQVALDTPIPESMMIRYRDEGGEPDTAYLQGPWGWFHEFGAAGGRVSFAEAEVRIFTPGGTAFEVEQVLGFDRPLTTDERDHLLGLNRAWTWDELTGQTGRISNVVQRGGLYAVAAELWRADRHGRRIDRIPTRHPVQGTITYNEDVDVKRKLSLEISDPQVLTPFRDFLIPVVTVADAAGNVTQRAKGLFQVTPPKTRLTPARFSGTIEGLDVTYLLRRYRFEDGYTVAAGTDKGAAAREVVLTAGFLPDRVHIPDTGIVFSDDYTFDPGSSAMEIATELLVGCNFYQPFADDEGMIRTGPTVDLQRAQPTSLMCTIRTAAQLVPPLDEDPDWNRLRNRITVRNLRPDQDPIYWTESVTNPDHPLYHDPADPDTFPMLLAGDPVDDPQLETVEQAKARARSLLADGASYYRKITVQTVIDLTAGAHDVVRVNVSHPAVRYSANWKRRAWTIRLQGATGIMTSELYRVDPWEA